MLASVIQVGDSKERTQSESFDSSFRASVHHLSQLRSGRVAIRRSAEWGSVLIVWLRAGSQCPRSAAADNLPARRPWKPRLRGVRTSGDAVPPRWGIPLSGVRFGGSTHYL